MNDEFAFIRYLLDGRLIHSDQIEVDVGDDAAVVIPTANQSLVMTCDTMVEEVHFLRNTMSPKEIGWKLLASNLSDLAAMGAKPTYALISISVPNTWQPVEIKEVYHGIHQLANEWKVTVMGGDTVKTSGPLTLTLTLLGEALPGQALRRSSAKSGDIVFVTGNLGDSAAGLHLLLQHPEKRETYSDLVQAHCRPEPQLRLGEWLMKSGYHPACDDISDGLANEAWEIAEASQVRLVLYEERFPLSTSLCQYAKEVKQDPIHWAWYGGEDYQLIGTICPQGWRQLIDVSETLGCQLTEIGRVESSDRPDVKVESKETYMTVPRLGYNHFDNR
jgi:thiamine-monophosphate kinase